jgi:ornithine lipid ester-linked acyl 2-hydroxylase
VLFVDFARPLHQPFHWLNRASLIGAGLLPLMRRAAARQRQWQRGFYEQTSKKKGA